MTCSTSLVHYKFLKSDLKVPSTLATEDILSSNTVSVPILSPVPPPLRKLSINDKNNDSSNNSSITSSPTSEPLTTISFSISQTRQVLFYLERNFTYFHMNTKTELDTNFNTKKTFS